MSRGDAYKKASANMADSNLKAADQVLNDIVEDAADGDFHNAWHVTSS